MEKLKDFQAVFMRLNMKIVTPIFLFCLWLILVPTRVLGQTDFGYLEDKEQVFFADYAAFREETGERFRVEVYYKIFTKILSFVKHEDKFKDISL